MPRAKLPSGIELEYDTFGEPSDKPLLLIMGLGAQMIAWRQAWCEILASKGFYVIRYDNRDVGLSTHLNEHPVPGPKQYFQAGVLRKRGLSAYKLKDMAEDAVGLLDHLKIEKAHICGASMGGMIAQEVGIRFGDRVASLTLIMTSPGDPRLGNPTLKVMMSAISHPKSKNAEKIIKYRAGHLLKIGSIKELQTPIGELLKHARETHERSPHRDGTTRQFFAVMNSRNRTPFLKQLKTPTLIIHGEVDPLVTCDHGKALSEIMPHARFELVKNMGHDMPPALYDSFSNMIVELAAAV